MIYIIIIFHCFTVFLIIEMKSFSFSFKTLLFYEISQNSSRCSVLSLDILHHLSFVEMI